MGLNIYAYVPETLEGGRVLYDFAPMAPFAGNKMVEGERVPNFRFSQPIRRVFHLFGVKMEEGYDIQPSQLEVIIGYLKLCPIIMGLPEWAGEEIRKFLQTAKDNGYIISVV